MLLCCDVGMVPYHALSRLLHHRSCRKAKDMLLGYQEVSSQWHSIASAAPSPKRYPTPSDPHPLPSSPKASLVTSPKPSVVSAPLLAKQPPPVNQTTNHTASCTLSVQLPSGPLASLSLKSTDDLNDDHHHLARGFASAGGCTFESYSPPATECC